MTAIRTILKNTWRGMVERRLWPVAALLLAALVAIPLVLRSEPEPVVRDQVAGDAAQMSADPLVAVASPAEREQVRRVLGRRKDPFKRTNQPRERKPQAQTARETAEKGPEPRTGATTPGSGGTGPAGGGGVGGSGGGGVTPPSPTTAPVTSDRDRPDYAAYSLTVRWGSSDDTDLAKGNVERLGALPSLDEPIVIYLGLTNRGRTAVFMVDENATVQGDGRCRPDPATCQTVALSRGETAFFDVEGEDGEVEQYQLDLVRIHAGAADASAARKGESAATTVRAARDGELAARTGRVARRLLRDGELGFRHDPDTGLLERVQDES